MVLKSMTGFARSDDAYDGLAWHWEVRTVNGRGLDVRLRLPNGYDGLEKSVRLACADRFKRGNCMISLNVQRSAGGVEIRLNEAIFGQVMAAAGRARELSGGQAASLDGLLALKGVLEAVEPDECESARTALLNAMQSSLEATLDGVVEARQEEGGRLQAVLADHISEIAGLVEAADGTEARTPDAISNRIKEQLALLLGEAPALEEGRLYQEAMLIAAKADIREELERLRAHVAAARDLMAADEAVGRKLDFLAQEFHREANTICSKSNDTELTRIGLNLKAVIDQLREQVQNIE